jgi:Bifunctional DNA primase/polymerase, N-terminal
MALASALKLAANLIPCFPCRADKRPACTNGFKDATTNAAKLRQLWSPNAELVGVPTGEASGLFVLDLDTAKHPEAHEWLKRYAAYLPKTREHRTQSGGLHLLFKHRPGLKSSTGKKKHPHSYGSGVPGVDTRGDGGYVVWWPCHLGLGTDDVALPAELPDWLIEALAPIEPKPQSTRHSNRFNVRQVAGALNVTRSAKPGDRNTALFWTSCRLGELVSDGVITHGAAISCALEAAEAAGFDASFTRASARSTIRSGLRHGGAQ